MPYDEHACAWNDTAKYSLTKPQIHNYEVVVSPGIIFFWKTMQNALNNHYRTLNLVGWDISDKMSVVIYYDKHNINFKM